MNVPGKGGKGSTALVFDIERCAVKDGPGIRSVVFFKGCTLNCAWCHNPEGISFQPQLFFDADKCKYCGACFDACVNKAHLLRDKQHVLDRLRCAGCFACCDVCFSGALRRVGTRMGLNELMEVLLQDEEYYKTSGGGVTLSGGEVSCQSSFALELLKALKRRCIHTAIETNLCFSDAGFALLREADLIMADVKTVSAEKFAQYIGSGFGQVLENLKALEQCKTPLIIRTPVVPGVNDGEEEIRSIALLLKGLGSLEYYELLSYHPLGEKKGECIDIRRTHFTQPSHQAMLRLAGIAKETGIDVRVDGKRV